MNDILTDLHVIAPELALALGTMALMIIGAFGRGGAFRLVSGLSLVLWAVVGAYVWFESPSSDVARVFENMLVLDHFARFVKVLVMGGCMAALMIGLGDIKGTVMARFEYPVLMGFSALGMFLMASANDLLSLYVGLELSSLALYVLAAFNRNNAISSEAGLKYFVLGALSSGLLLFGSSLIYGYVGTTQFDVIQATLSVAAVPGPAPVVVIFGMVLVISGIAFKVAAVPFHMWTPDVYEGAPTSVTAFFALVPKIAAMALLIRLVTGPFEPVVHDWKPVITLMSLASMIVGAYAAIIQTNIKRLLAYSSIGNIGYALIGVATGTHFGLASVLMYVAIYMVMTAGTFGIILLLRREGTSIERIADLAGLSKIHPVAAYALAAFMFSMSGIPPLAGFFGKLVVFQAAVAAQAYVLAVLGVLTSVVAAWYYINIIRVMFFENAPGNQAHPVTVNPSLGGIIITTLSLAIIVGFVLMPGPLTTATSTATSGLLP